MEEMLNINGIEYIKKDSVSKILKERDEAVNELKTIKEIVGKSFKDLAFIINNESKKEESKVVKTVEKKSVQRKITRKGSDPFELIESSKKLFRIRFMDELGKFYSANNKPMAINIKHVFEVQKALHNGVTNEEMDNLAKKLGINYQIFHRLIYNYQKNIFDKFIIQWNKRTQPMIGNKNKPVENNPQKRKESGLYA